MLEYNLLAVGAKIHPSVPQEGMVIELNHSGISLVTRFDNPTKHEIKGFKSGIKNIGLYIYEDVFPVIFLLVEFNTNALPKFDCPYNIRLADEVSNEVKKDMDEILETECNVLQYVLTDNQTIVSMGVFGVPWPLMNLLKSTALKQRQIEFSRDQYMKHLDEIYKKFTTQAMFDKAIYMYKK